RNKAFEIDTNKIVSESKITEIRGEFKKRAEECKTQLVDLCRRNFIANVDISAISPWLSVFLGTTIALSKEMLEEVSTKYQCTKVEKAELKISESSIILTKKFKNEVERALSEKTTPDKIIKLREISKKYGHFYARRIVFGGAMIEKITNFETS
ncbi:8249_t:CDS:1, partial [Racocetra fulgida]